MNESNDRSNMMRVLDGAEVIATTIYVVLLAMVAIAILAVLTYLVLNPPRSFGSQGEWFYVAIAFLLVIFWVIGQAAWLIRRRRRAASDGAWRPPRPEVEMTPSRFSMKWNVSPTGHNQAAQKDAWTWTTQSVPVSTTTFRLDDVQLAAAREARAAGKSWEEIAKQVNSDHGFLSTFEQSLYQRALQLAVDASIKK